jgi:hypothetical protein
MHSSGITASHALEEIKTGKNRNKKQKLRKAIKKRNATSYKEQK